MGPDGDSDARSDAERRLLNLLRLLAGEPPPVPDPQRIARTVRRARVQRDLRPALIVSAGLAATMIEAFVPLLARSQPRGRA